MTLSLLVSLACTGPTGDSGTSGTGSDTGDTTPTSGEHGCNTAGLTGAFVTREGDELVLDGDPFRFVSINVPNLHVLEDPIWDLPTAWEQADAMCTIQQMGGRVARTYVLSVGDSGYDLPRHVVAPGEFSEELFEALDQAVAQAGRHGIRLIIPFVDQWWWWGGIADYAAFRELDEDEFWTDEQVITDFEETVRFLVERENTVTGVTYRDDPTILAWETGNELDAPSDWTARIAALLKDLDPNHLVMDGGHGIDLASLENPDVDVVSDHYYGNPPYWDDYAAAASAGQAIAAGARPFVIGEFGLVETERIAELLDTVVAEGIAGSMIWSLRFHNEGGGFYWHTEVQTDESLYRSYHWPGFESGEDYDEAEVLQLHREAAYVIQGLDVPDAPVPAPPVVLSADDASAITWQGSTGAESYSLERLEGEDGTWEVLAIQLDDAVYPNTAVTKDPNQPRGIDLYYRMRAHGLGGVSEPSEAIGPFQLSSDRVFVDGLSDLDHLAQGINVTVDGSNPEYFDGDEGRLTRADFGDGQAIWNFSGFVRSFEVHVYHWPHEERGSVVLETSDEGVRWESSSVSETEDGGDWERVVLHVSDVPEDAKWVRITLEDHAGEVWNPQVSEVVITWDPGED